MFHYLSVEQFIRSVLTDPEPDLSFYSEKIFCRELKLRALKAVEARLLHMQQQQLDCASNNTNFDFNQFANEADPETGLTLLDYVVIAGIHELAYNITAWGCKGEFDGANFSKILNVCFSKHTPPIINDIYKTLQLIKYGNIAARVMPADKDQLATQIKQFLKKITSLIVSYDPPDPKLGTRIHLYNSRVTQHAHADLRSALKF